MLFVHVLCQTKSKSNYPVIAKTIFVSCFSKRTNQNLRLYPFPVFSRERADMRIQESMGDLTKKKPETKAKTEIC